MAVMERLTEISRGMSNVSARIEKIEKGLSEALPEFKLDMSKIEPSAELRSISTETTPPDTHKNPIRASSETTEVPLTAGPTPPSALDSHLPVIPSEGEQATLSQDEVPPDATDHLLPEESHTTPAHQLLDLWPCMAQFKQPKRYPKDYPLTMENNRGLLRPYGRGEGSDVGDGSHPAGHLTSANSPSEDYSPAPSPPEGLWGVSLAPGPPPNPGGRNEYPGGLSPDGSLNLDERVVNRLFESYTQNIHKLHPFLNYHRLKRMIDTFTTRYGTTPGFSKPSFVVPSSRNNLDSYGGLPQKRKLSNGPPSSGPPTSFDPSGFARRVPERSISNAIVLLVLAVGQICEAKLPFCGPVSTNESIHFSETSPMMEHAEASPVQIKQSPSSSSPPMSVTSPGTEGARLGQRSGRSSTEPIMERGQALRNVDRIPGLAYYAYASDILGNLHNGHELAHIQAFLLAGLYMGQLCRALESWGWINSACRAWMVLAVKISRADLWNRASDTQQDLIKFAFWTCLQLER